MCVQGGYNKENKIVMRHLAKCSLKPTVFSNLLSTEGDKLVADSVYMYMCFIYTHYISCCVYRKVALDYENADFSTWRTDQKGGLRKIGEHFSLFKSVIFLLIYAMEQCAKDMFAIVYTQH